MSKEAFKTLIDIVKHVNIERYATTKIDLSISTHGPMVLCLYSGVHSVATYFQ